MTKLARYSYGGTERLGVLRNDHYIDITRAYVGHLETQGAWNADAIGRATLPADAITVIAGGATALTAIGCAIDYAEQLPPAQARAAEIVVPVKDTTTLIPIPNPPKIICVARNYRAHAEEAGLPVSEIPILFPRFANTQVADGAAVILPEVSPQLDWEGELAVVIGRRGRHISRQEAMGHVGGYTIFNDVSVRDFQFRVTQYTAGKNFQATAPVGPNITLTDEGVDPHRLQLRTLVNGVTKQSANTSDMIFTIPTLIEHISEFVELEPGDIIPTGTPAGVGFKRNPPEFLKDGDRVDVEIEGIGVLTNPVQREVKHD